MRKRFVRAVIFLAIAVGAAVGGAAAAGAIDIGSDTATSDGSWWD